MIVEVKTSIVTLKIDTSTYAPSIVEQIKSQMDGSFDEQTIQKTIHVVLTELFKE